LKSFSHFLEKDSNIKSGLHLNVRNDKSHDWPSHPGWVSFSKKKSNFFLVPYFLYIIIVAPMSISPSKVAAIHAYRNLLKTQKQVFFGNCSIQ
jgi:hypothetical protein